LLIPERYVNGPSHESGSRSRSTPRTTLQFRIPFSGPVVWFALAIHSVSRRQSTFDQCNVTFALSLTFGFNVSLGSFGVHDNRGPPGITMADPSLVPTLYSVRNDILGMNFAAGSCTLTIAGSDVELAKTVQFTRLRILAEAGCASVDAAPPQSVCT
jgi:hypothetical protein